MKLVKCLTNSMRIRTFVPEKDKHDKLEFEEKNTEFNFWAKKR